VSFDNSAENYLISKDHAVGSDLDCFIQYFHDKRFKKALDVACAAGHFGNVFPADMIFTTDLSFNMLKTARESMGFDMPALSRSEFLPYKNGSFELVGCRIAMHHFRNPCMFMGEVFRVLADDGYFVLIDSVVGKEDKELNEIELIRDTTHRRSLKFEDIVGMAEAEGFTLENSVVTQREHAFEAWARRLKPTEDQYQATKSAFLALPAKIKKELNVVIKGDEVISYTDKKGIFIFKKS